MISPSITLIFIIGFNGLYLWNKCTLINNEYDVSWFYGVFGDIQKMIHLARKTENQSLRISYMIRGWLFLLAIPVLIILIFNTTYHN
jgi:uncharacterized membrane protein YiaA